MPESRRVRMRSLPLHEAVKTFDEVLLGYSREEAMAEATRALAFDLSEAAARCPFDVDIARFVGQVAEGDFDAALATIRQAHPWPEMLGRHCHKFCERYRTPPGVDRPLLGALEWAAGRFGDPSHSPFRAGAPTGRRVAVVGAGSAGLACAWALRRYGHAVEIFDREPVPSGLLFTGYPPFRTSKRAVLRDHQPAEWGATLYLSHGVEPAELRQLVEERDAVFLGLGLAPVPQLQVEGEDLEGVWSGLEVLRATWFGFPPKIGPRVLVVGGGFTALDVVRTAIRLGCSPVEMVYRRGIQDMPLNPGLNEPFVAMVEAEGVTCRFMTTVSRIVGDQGRVVGAELVRTEYGELDSSGRPSVGPVPGSERTIAVDSVIPALGEIPDVGWLLQPTGVQLTAGGFIAVDPITRQTSNPKLWAGGDVIGSLGNDGAALDGFWAGAAMDAFFRGSLDTWRAQASLRVKDMSHEPPPA